MLRNFLLAVLLLFIHKSYADNDFDLIIAQNQFEPRRQKDISIKYQEVTLT